MSSYGDIKTNESIMEENHDWIVDLDIIVGKPCCNGPIFRPRETRHTHDLSEANEDRYVKAAEVAVRLAFHSARQQKMMARILEDAGHPLPHPEQDPNSGK